jgi:hydroxypyruvate reductase
MNPPDKVPKWKDHRTHLDQISSAALAAVNPEQIVRSCLSVKDDKLLIFDSSFDLHPSSKIYVVGAGKAGYGMASALQDVFGDRITAGVVAIPQHPAESTRRIEFITGGHPTPTEGSIEAGKRIAALLENTKEGDLVIVLISGGGSALLEYPEEGIQLTDLIVMNNLLLRSGAPIHEINTIRRQLSKIKGGGLARMAVPAKVITLILSDVVGDPLSDIASGPTVPDRTSVVDAPSILDKYRLTESTPEAILSFFRNRADLRVERAEKIQALAEIFLVGNNRIAADAAKATASEIGFQATVVTTTMQGEAANVGKVIAALLVSVRDTNLRRNKPACLIFGGETTVTVHGKGLGGRNQETALAAALELSGIDRIVLMTLATDGVDGPTPAAGAIATGETIAIAKEMGLEPAEFLADNDSYTFFNKLEDTIITGVTGTNVNDLVLGLIY